MDNRCKRDKKCPVCGVLIMRKSTTCRSCHQKGNLSHNWGGGKAKCKLCGKMKSGYKAGFCSTCFKGSNHFAWKGDNAGYGSNHDYIRKIFGKPKSCCLCGSISEERRYEWASKAGYYSKDKSDYFTLCKSCHIRYDHIRKELNIGHSSIYGK